MKKNKKKDFDNMFVKKVNINNGVLKIELSDNESIEKIDKCNNDNKINEKNSFMNDSKKNNIKKGKNFIINENKIIHEKNNETKIEEIIDLHEEGDNYSLEVVYDESTKKDKDIFLNKIKKENGFNCLKCSFCGKSLKNNYLSFFCKHSMHIKCINNFRIDNFDFYKDEEKCGKK